MRDTGGTCLARSIAPHSRAYVCSVLGKAGEALDHCSTDADVWEAEDRAPGGWGPPDPCRMDNGSWAGGDVAFVYACSAGEIGANRWETRA